MIQKWKPVLDKMNVPEQRRQECADELESAFCCCNAEYRAKHRNMLPIMNDMITTGAIAEFTRNVIPRLRDKYSLPRHLTVG